jgi:hypothetical protein
LLPKLVIFCKYRYDASLCLYPLSS